MSLQVALSGKPLVRFNKKRADDVRQRHRIVCVRRSTSQEREPHRVLFFPVLVACAYAVLCRDGTGMLDSPAGRTASTNQALTTFFSAP